MKMEGYATLGLLLVVLVGFILRMVRMGDPKTRKQDKNAAGGIYGGENDVSVGGD